jgi:hypothetical protein
MASTSILKNVPPGDVGGIVQSFIDNDGATAVEVSKQANGNFTVEATLPDTGTTSTGPQVAAP